MGFLYALKALKVQYYAVNGILYGRHHQMKTMNPNKQIDIPMRHFYGPLSELEYPGLARFYSEAVLGTNSELSGPVPVPNGISIC